MRYSVFVAIALAAALAGCANAGPTSGTQPADMEATKMSNDNHINYAEFAAADLGAFKQFYGDAFGWTFQDWGPDYVSFEGAGLDGGVRKGDAAPGTTLVILYADDLDASEKRVVDAGGRIIERHDFPGGRRFHFRDPTGNVLGVWTKAED